MQTSCCTNRGSLFNLRELIPRKLVLWQFTRRGNLKPREIILLGIEPILNHENPQTPRCCRVACCDVLRDADSPADASLRCPDPPVPHATQDRAVRRSSQAADLIRPNDSCLRPRLWHRRHGHTVKQPLHEFGVAQTPGQGRRRNAQSMSQTGERHLPEMAATDR